MVEELGDRVPETIQQKFEEILDGDIMIPSLSHYVRYGYIYVID
jgi:hypothetical protein